MSKTFWSNLIIMIVLIMFIATYNFYNGLLYWLHIICIGGLGMYFVREATDNQLKKK